MKQSFSTDIITTLLIGLFSYTAVSKIYDGDAFIGVLRRIPMIAKGADLLAWAIPLAELYCVLLLFFPFTRLTGLKCAALLLAAFTLFLGYMVVFVPHLPCSCGGIISQLSWQQHIVVNILLLILTIYSIRKFFAQTPVAAEARHYRQVEKAWNL